MLKFPRKLSRLLTTSEKRGALILFGLMVIGAVLEVIGVGAIPAFVALLSGPERILRYAVVRQGFAVLGANSPQSRVLWAAVALAVLYFVKNTYLGAMSYWQARYIYNRQVALSTRLFRAYLHSPYAFHLQRNTADLLHTTEHQTLHVVADVYLSILRIAMEVLVLLAILVLIVVIEPMISLGMVLLLGVTSALFLRAVRQRVTRFGEDEHRFRARMLQAVHQGLGGLKDVKVLGREEYFLNVFTHNARVYTRAGGFKVAIFEFPRLFLEVVAVLAMLGVAALFIYQGRSMQAIVPVLTLLALAAVRLLPSTNRIVNAVVALRWARPAVDTIHDDLQLLEPRVGFLPAAASQPLHFKEAIEFRDVRYKYPGASVESLCGINVRIPCGTAVAFIGPSGGGKTTTIDVLLGLLQPTAGEVLVDGKDIATQLASWQRLIGYVPQSVYLTDDSIRRNVAFGIGDSEIDDEKVWTALEAAQLKEFVADLPAKLDTSVGERGVRLSGGQRQRIAVARALYHNPPVLVMDEATSALDHRTESLLMDTIERLRDGRTIIAIAHRQTTVRRFDKILVLRDGKLEAQGQFSEALVPSA